LIGVAGAALPSFILAAAIIGRRKVHWSRDSHEYK
jgi:hypothetical protein